MSNTTNLSNKHISVHDVTVADPARQIRSKHWKCKRPERCQFEHSKQEAPVHSLRFRQEKCNTKIYASIRSAYR